MLERPIESYLIARNFSISESAIAAAVVIVLARRICTMPAWKTREYGKDSDEHHGHRCEELDHAEAALGPGTPPQLLCARKAPLQFIGKAPLPLKA